MKKYIFCFILITFFAGCSDSSTNDTKVKKNPLKKTEPEELSIKDIESITARVNYKFSQKNIVIDSSAYVDSVKKEISEQIKLKRK